MTEERASEDRVEGLVPTLVEQFAYRRSATRDGLIGPFMAPDLPLYFVPRAEIAEIKQHLLTHSGASLAPVTLYGPPGMGKTALAAAICHDADVIAAYPDGVLWVSLGREGDAQQAQAMLGEALGCDLSDLPETGARAAALRSALGDRRCLLVIDDLTDVEQVRALNIGGQNCARLITLDSSGDLVNAFRSHRIMVGGMSEAECLDLLGAWAGLLPDLYQPTIKEIVKRLSYAPLALALVGGQARQGITWLRLLEVLRDAQGPIAMLDPKDHGTRSAALSLVINLVLSRFGGGQLQRAALLGVMAAGTAAPFSVEAAAACWQVTSQEAVSTLKLLQEASLVQNAPDSMFSLHTSLRDHLYGAAVSTDRRNAANRVRDYYLDVVEQSAVSPERVDAQIGQIMAVFRQVSLTDAALANIFADGLLTYFERRGLWGNLVTLASQIVERARSEGDVLREYSYLPEVGYAHTVLGNMEKARVCFARSLEIAETLGDPSGQAGALNNLGAIYEREGNYAEAESYYVQSLLLREPEGATLEVAETLYNVAGAQYLQGHHDDALATFQRALEVFAGLGERTREAQTLLNIGAVHESLNKDSEALYAYQRSLAIYSNANDDAGQAQALNNIGIHYLNIDDYERALAHFKRSLALKERLGDRPGQASTLNNIALLYERTGSLSLALDYYERSYRLLEALGDPRSSRVQHNIELLHDKMGR